MYVENCKQRREEGEKRLEAEARPPRDLQTMVRWWDIIQ